MALKFFKGNVEPQCGYCEFACIAKGSDIVVCKKAGGIYSVYSKCRKYKYDPLKRTPKSPVFNNDFSKEDFEL